MTGLDPDEYRQHDPEPGGHAAVVAGAFALAVIVFLLGYAIGVR